MRPAPDFKLNADRVRNQLTPRTRVVIISNLHNPTGTHLTPREIKDIAEVVAEIDGVLVVDTMVEPLADKFIAEIRKLAEQIVAKHPEYGSAAELLREDWIPAIPGINVPGDYANDYARDPETYMKQEARKAYGEAIDRAKKEYK